MNRNSAKIGLQYAVVKKSSFSVDETSFLTLVSIQSDESTCFPDVNKNDGVRPGKAEGGNSKKRSRLTDDDKKKRKE
ncbi:hypothetical protein TNCV_2170151 [Trichonephila clavipes]|nr:hypothetical protein TNCV_2170151 [Trichonephila clavipes]